MSQQHDNHCSQCTHVDDFELSTEVGFEVTFKHTYAVSQAQLWDYLTHTDLLAQWFPELEFASLTAGGVLNFHTPDGEAESMLVMDVEAPEYLSFTWDINTVTFALKQINTTQTELTFVEWIAKINHYTPVDLTTWYIRLSNLHQLIEGESLTPLETSFNDYYPSMVQLLQQQTDFAFINSFA